MMGNQMREIERCRAELVIISEEQRFALSERSQRFTGPAFIAAGAVDLLCAVGSRFLIPNGVGRKLTAVLPKKMRGWAGKGIKMLTRVYMVYRNFVR